jgi:phospholipid/cholesterol/gamma-HCH transport system substrate-binding protein
MRRFPKLRVILVVLVIIVGGTVAANSFSSRTSGQRMVIAEFADVSPIEPGEQVKIHGVTVGKLGKPMIDPERKVSLVPMELDPSALPLHTDSSVQVAPISLLGERYLKLDPGKPTSPTMPFGQHIPANRTGQSVDLQDVVNSLDDPTSGSLASMLITLGRGTDHNGLNVQKTLQAVGPAMTDTDSLARVLQQQNKLLGRVIDNVEPVTSSLAADRGKRMDGLVNNAKTLLDTTHERDHQLQETIRELPSTLNQAQQTLDTLNNTSQTTTATLGNLRPTTDNLSQISTELDHFTQTANPALASANPVLDRANDLLDQARPVAQQLHAAAPNVSGTAHGARPIVTDLNNNLGNVLDFVRYWALATNGRDGLSHYFRAHFVASDQTASGLLPGGGPNGAGDPGTQPQPRPRLDQPSPPLPDPGASAGKGGPLGGLIPGPPQQPGSGGMPGGLLQNQPSPSGSATGLNQSQEQGALGFLLGGH